MNCVLVIDDDPVSRELLLLLLKRQGHQVRIADSGAQALESLAAHDRTLPQIILADLQMPGISGERLARALREICGDGPVLIAMSGSSPDQAVCREYDAFLLKPFTMEEFAAAATGRGGGSKAEHVDEHIPVLDRVVHANLAASMSPEQLERLYSLCLDDAVKRIAAMQQAVSTGDEDSYKRQAHAIKGGCGMVGAIELQRLATTMEDKGLAANHVATLHEFLLACERLRGMLNAHENATM